MLEAGKPNHLLEVKVVRAGSAGEYVANSLCGFCRKSIGHDSPYVNSPDEGLMHDACLDISQGMKPYRYD
jgi:hypothetical protein